MSDCISCIHIRQCPHSMNSSSLCSPQLLEALGVSLTIYHLALQFNTQQHQSYKRTYQVVSLIKTWISSSLNINPCHNITQIFFLHTELQSLHLRLVLTPSLLSSAVSLSTAYFLPFEQHRKILQTLIPHNLLTTIQIPHVPTLSDPSYAF